MTLKEKIRQAQASELAKRGITNKATDAKPDPTPTGTAVSPGTPTPELGNVESPLVQPATEQPSQEPSTAAKAPSTSATN